MLKMYANGTKDGKPKKIVVLGLSHANLDRLREGRPVRFDGVEVDLPEAYFIIFSGESEPAMMEEFTSLIGPNTKVSINPRLKS